MSTAIMLPKNTPIVTFCGVASRFMHSIKLTFISTPPGRAALSGAR